MKEEFQSIRDVGILFSNKELSDNYSVAPTSVFISQTKKETVWEF